MAKKTAVPMKNSTFSEKGQTSVIAFLQEFRSERDACGIYKNADRLQFRHYIAGWPEAAVKSRVKLPNFATFYHRSTLKSYNVFVKLVLKS